MKSTVEKMVKVQRTYIRNSDSDENLRRASPLDTREDTINIDDNVCKAAGKHIQEFFRVQ